jgi:hypothetical protein
MIPVAQQDVEARLQRTLTTDEVEWLPGVTDEASALVETYLGVTYGPTDTIPGPIGITTSRVAARVLATTGANQIPVGLDQRSAGMGPFNASLHFISDSTSGGPWLSAVDKIVLNPYRVGAVQSVPLNREGVLWDSAWSDPFTE